MRQHPAAVKLTHHRTGLAVTVNVTRTWEKARRDALRILSARVHTHDKGVKRLAEDNPGEYVLNENGSYSATVAGNTYTVTLIGCQTLNEMVKVLELRGIVADDMSLAEFAAVHGIVDYRELARIITGGEMVSELHNFFGGKK